MCQIHQSIDFLKFNAYIKRITRSVSGISFRNPQLVFEYMMGCLALMLCCKQCYQLRIHAGSYLTFNNFDMRVVNWYFSFFQGISHYHFDSLIMEQFSITCGQYGDALKNYQTMTNSNFRWINWDLVILSIWQISQMFSKDNE